MTTFEMSSYAITRICCLQTELFDYTGHVRKGMSRDDRKRLVNEINRMREMVGWKLLKTSPTGTRR